jgi:hypothetical protein
MLGLVVAKETFNPHNQIKQNKHVTYRKLNFNNKPKQQIITKIGTMYVYLDSFIQDDIKVSLKSKERNKMKTI